MTDTLVKQIDKTEVKSASLARTALAVVLSALSGLFFAGFPVASSVSVDVCGSSRFYLLYGLPGTR